jgi:hypothetical protein
MQVDVVTISRGTDGETNVSTEQSQEEEDPRVPDTDPDSGWSSHPRPASRQGQGDAVRLATPTIQHHATTPFGSETFG